MDVKINGITFLGCLKDGEPIVDGVAYSHALSKWGGSADSSYYSMTLGDFSDVDKRIGYLQSFGIKALPREETPLDLRYASPLFATYVKDDCVEVAYTRDFADDVKRKLLRKLKEREGIDRPLSRIEREVLKEELEDILYERKASSDERLLFFGWFENPQQLEDKAYLLDLVQRLDRAYPSEVINNLKGYSIEVQPTINDEISIGPFKDRNIIVTAAVIPVTYVLA